MTPVLPLLVALQFLTRLPLRLSERPTADAQARSLLWYPLVGAFAVVAVVLALRSGRFFVQ